MLVLAACLLASRAHADSAVTYQAATTTAQLTRIGVGARAEAMAGAFAGLCDDATAMYWNPAGLAQIEDAAFSLSHQTHIAGIRQEAVTFGQRLGTRAVFGLSAAFQSFGTFDGYASEHTVPVPLSATDYYGSGGIALRLPSFAFGIAAKFLRSSYESDLAGHLALDAGLLGVWSATGISIGGSVSNLEVPLKSGAAAAPAVARFGIAYPFGRLPLMIALQGDYAFDASPAAAVGAEYWIQNLVAVRAGYRAYLGESRLSRVVGLSAGLGVQWQGWSLSYSFQPWDDLGSSHRVTLMANL